MRSWRRVLTMAGAVGLAAFITAVPVLAAEAEQDPTQSPTGTVFRWLNFLLVFGTAGYLIAKNGGAFFRSNAKAIVAGIEEASAVKAQAEREFREVAAKAARLDQEAAELRETAKRDSAAEEERLRASGRAEIEKINEAARAELVSAERAAQQELRALAAAIAVERAAALVRSRMNPEVRGRIFQTFLGELERSAN